MNEVLDRKPQVVTAVHMKGGCGKTTVLTDLGITFAMEGYRVLALDTDIQGSMISTLTGVTRKRYKPSLRYHYLDDVNNGVRLISAQTDIPEVNANITVMHYPIEMFYPDAFHKPEFIERFAEILHKQVREAQVVLVDMAPARLVTPEVEPFKLLAPEVDQLTFLLVNRPNPKEVEDGIACYENIREMIILGKVPADMIRPLLVLNFASVKSKESEWHLIEQFGSLSLVEGRGHMVADSPFSDLSVEDGVIPEIKFPNVARSGADMRRYSILLDVDLRSILNEMRDGRGYGVDHVLDHLDEDPFDVATRDAKLEPYYPYVASIHRIVEQIFPKKVHSYALDPSDPYGPPPF